MSMQPVPWPEVSEGCRRSRDSLSGDTLDGQKRRTPGRGRVITPASGQEDVRVALLPVRRPGVHLPAPLRHRPATTPTTRKPAPGARGCWECATGSSWPSPGCGTLDKPTPAWRPATGSVWRPRTGTGPRPGTCSLSERSLADALREAAVNARMIIDDDRDRDRQGLQAEQGPGHGVLQRKDQSPWHERAGHRGSAGELIGASGPARGLARDHRGPLARPARATLSKGQKAVNFSHTKRRASSERANAQLKAGHNLTRLRDDPARPQASSQPSPP
jgi:hypothetical protein